MSIPLPDPPANNPVFGATKREILLILKREGQTDLQTLADRLNISKMGVHKHVQELEERGLIERILVRGGTGRPRLALRLAPSATSLFPRAYAGVTCAALAYIEEKLGRKGVEEALRRRQTETLTGYRDQVKAETLAERVHHLAGPAKFEILEHNCPILAVAENYWEACTIENELFRKVLDANVETTHRVVAGGNVCRFLVTPKRRTPG